MARVFTTPIVLPGDPSSSNQASNKSYVDTGLAGKANASHTHAESDVTGLVSDLAGKVPTSRQVSAGTGLSGGGDLTADRSLAVSFGTSSTTACVGNDSRLSDLVRCGMNRRTWISQ